MLSIGAIAKGQAKYYLNLAQEDYYLSGGEPPGWWWGKAAACLKLQGTVLAPDLNAVFKGKLHGKALVQNAGHSTRRPGFDLTFSAPKSVSVLWAVAPDDMRQAIIQAHRAAVEEALSYVQDEAAFTRSGKAGEILHKADILVALFEHGTSRALDPHLHTHALLVNIALAEDLIPRALVHTPIYEHAMVAGALYRCALARELQSSLHLKIERDGSSFKITGVSQAFCDEMSKRRAEIVAAAGEAGLETARQMQKATLDTRQAKVTVPSRQSLHENWKKDGLAFNFSEAQARDLPRQQPSATPQSEAFDKAMKRAVTSLTSERSHFAGMDLLRAVATESQGNGMRPDEILEKVKIAIQTDPQFRLLGMEDSPQERVITTEETWSRETQLLAAAKALHLMRPHTASSMAWSTPMIENTIYEHRLSAEQAQAVRHLVYRDHGKLRVLEGLAGTGKSSAFRVAREIWEKRRMEPFGVALSGKAALELKKNSGMNTMTFAKLEAMYKPSWRRTLAHEAKMLGRAFAGKGRYDNKPPKLTPRHVIVVDEASMLDTRQMTWLLKKAQSVRATVVLAGDRLQLQAIGQGGAFSLLADRFGKAQLNDILRQKDPEYRQAVFDLANGESRKALTYFHKQGQLHIEKSPDATLLKLVEDWKARELPHDMGQSLIFTSTREQAAAANLLCQKARLDAGHLRRLASIQHRGERFYINDRVLFTAPNHKRGVVNGQIGVVEAVNPFTHSIKVRMDQEQVIDLPLRRKTGIALGYAVTTHKGQGSTVDRGYVLAGGAMMYKQIAYVQASRARLRTDIYLTGDADYMGHREFARKMDRSREKTTAHTFAKMEREMEHEL